jgi:7-cyano-7-deazaguanine synthase in queuosine biosynthesis
MLKTISHKQFLLNLSSRKHEDISAIAFIEQSLLKKRKYVFRMPKKGDSVILLVSGGLDSITAWGILMKQFGLHVYPLALNKGEKKEKHERAAITYFSKYYKKRYPHLFHKPQWLSIGTEPIAMPIERGIKQMHPDILLQNISRNGKVTGFNFSLGSTLLLPVYAKLYAEYLNYSHNLNIHTIFCAVNVTDGIVVPHQSFTALRSMMYYLCATTGDYRWQYTSAVFEKELGLYYTKSDLVTWAAVHSVPLEKTWTCSFGYTYQCGGPNCITCLTRKDAFLQAHVEDKTIYRPIASQSFIGNMRYIGGQIKHALKRFI